MKITTLLVIMLTFSTAWGASFRDKKNVLSDSCLVVSNDKKSVTIEQGKRIFVRVEGLKINGIYKYATDSTIYVDEQEVKLLEINMIAKSKTGKTVGMFFAQLPISIFGFALMAVSSGYGSGGGTVAGVALIGVGLTGATLESYRGKRYRAYKHPKKNNPTKIRNWEYSVRRK